MIRVESKEIVLEQLGNTTKDNPLKKPYLRRGYFAKAHVMSLGDIFNKFFGETDKRKRKKEEDEIIKSLCLAACENKHKILLECYKASWVGGCKTEMDSFWKCVNDQKAVLKEKAKTYRKNMTT